MNNIPDQEWCGQEQSHAPHIWIKQGSTGTGYYRECAGHK